MKKICIVASKYYEDIINMLVGGSNDVLNNHKKKIKTKIIYVPGVFEIPSVSYTHLTLPTTPYV